MCGILGFTGPHDPSTLRLMMERLRHRGPDGDGSYSDEGISLGHTRLAILDLPGGSQPLFSQNRNTSMIFNGEIFNHLSLRKELGKKGHVFHTSCDSEVIIRGYEEWGESLPHHLEGMFAFALWNKKEKKLFIARDRTGIKPIYYVVKNKRFYFASELKALMAVDQNWELAHESLAMHLFTRHTLGPGTLVRGIKKLPPGCSLTVTKDTEVQIKNFWEFKWPKNRIRSFDEAFERTRTSLSSAVSSHLQSDVPLGIFLSGGIDSGVITALAAQSIEKLNTFTIGFEGESANNEFERARAVAKKYNTHHTEMLIHPGDLNLLPQVIWHQDEPVAGPSSLAYYKMMEAAAQSVKVVLVGHGADEIFLGYEQLKILNLALKFKGTFSRNVLWAGSSGLSRLLNDEIFKRLSHFTKNLANPIASYYTLTGVFSDRELSLLLNTPYSNPEKVLHDHFPCHSNFNEAIAQAEFGPWLSEDLLLRLDRMSMAHGIEARVPFLDNQVVRLGQELDPQFKLNGRTDKFILRKLAKDLLPPGAFNITKQRFTTPVDRIFGKRYFEFCRTFLLERSEIAKEIFKQKYVENLIDFQKNISYRILKRHKLYSQYYARQLWALLVFCIWYELYFNNRSPRDFSI